MNDNKTLPATWPDNTKLKHAAKVIAIKALCAQSRETQPLPKAWPAAADKKGGAQ